jgi:hypothetical protein
MKQQRQWEAQELEERTDVTMIQEVVQASSFVNNTSFVNMGPIIKVEQPIVRRRKHDERPGLTNPLFLI